MIVALILWLLKYTSYIFLTWLVLFLLRELVAYILVRKLASKHGIPYRYYPVAGFFSLLTERLARW